MSDPAALTGPAWPEAEHIADLAAELPPLVRFGTSSWTYPGWRGLIYHTDYPATGSSARQLAEYARWPLFRTVGIDSFFYRPASVATLRAYADALPTGFPCASKVWERITAHSFTSPRDRPRSGERNPDWLNASLFADEVLAPMVENFADHLGPLIFEFQTIAKREGITPDAFANALDRFFAALPRSARYAVEVRNTEFLTDAYFAVLRTHRVAHVFSSWTRMPAVGEQLLLHDSITTDFVIARALLRPGRSYARAVDAFAPYDRIQDENPALRNDLAALARTALNLRIPAYVIVNNRAEGCAPLTIAAIAAMLIAA
ncbi:MAG: DUF72 domain-containing protein [Gemmatimonadales bacterium]